MPGQADAFKACIESPLDNGIVCQRRYDLGRDLLTAGKVDQLNGTAVNAVGEQQDFKYRRLYIAIHTGFRQVLIAIGLDID